MGINEWVSWSNYRPAIPLADILGWHSLIVWKSSVNHHGGSSLSLMLCLVLFLVLFALSHTLLEDNRRPLPLCRLVEAEHVSFAHKVRQFIIIGFLIGRLLKQLWMLLYSTWYAEGMKGSTARYMTPSIIFRRQNATSLLTLSDVELARLVINESNWLLPAVCHFTLMIATRTHTTPTSAIKIEPRRRICIIEKVLG